MPTIETAEQEAEAIESSKKEKKAKKKTGRGLHRLGMAGFLLFLGVGTAIGLHYAGVWDGRTFLYETLPKIPVLGPSLAKAFRVPQLYSLSPQERRKIELDEREQILVLREASADVLLSALERVSRDANDRLFRIRETEQRLGAQIQTLSTEVESKARGAKEIEDLLRVYQEMSPRNAATILSGIQEDLAVTLLSRMPQDQTASILAKMDPAKAAILTERLSRKREGSP